MALRKAGRAVTRLYDDRLAAHGMTITQFAILRNLARDGELQLNRLAEKMGMDRTSLYRTIAPVERNGWITITAGPGRARIARLSDAGGNAMVDAEVDWIAAQQHILGGISPEQWQALQDTLGRLTAMVRP